MSEKFNAPLPSTANVQNAICAPNISASRLPRNAQHFKEEKYPELTIKSFFEFMRTAYGVHNSFEDLVNTVTANSEIDWNALTQTELNPSKAEDNAIKHNQILQSDEKTNKNAAKYCKSEPSGETSSVSETNPLSPPANSSLQNEEPVLSMVMKKQLSDILHEGLLDSVLPYMLPKATLSETVTKKLCTNAEPRRSISLNDNRDVAKVVKEKLKEKDNFNARRKSFENEIEIHVCDEVKNLRKDFRCPQKLLIQNMCYFADVTAGQKLEEMDISVHCDIAIFDWLMRWVKKDIIKKSEWPILEANNVIPIMVSASFLQMEPLLNTCLQFCHDHMSDILKTSSVLSCLNDNLLTRLAELFSNMEIETLKDKKDKIQSKLFCKLIMLLAYPIPDNSKGHYSSLAYMFKCGKCDKNIVRSLSDFIPCIPSSMQIDKCGELHNKHTRNLTWNLDDYIVLLRSELRSWRKVYWKLWGDCHFLFCRQCDTYFPVNQMDWCAYHPEKSQFFLNEQNNSFYPIGRFPCCSQRTFKFEVLSSRNGCNFKEHMPKIITKQEEDILEIFSSNRDIIAINPPQLYFPEKITRLVARDPSLEAGKLYCKEPSWWEGIELVPPRPKLGLLGKIWGSGFRRICQTPTKSEKKLRRQESRATDGSSPILSITDSEDDGEATECESSIEDDSYNSEESQQLLKLNFIKLGKKGRMSRFKRNNVNGAWNDDLTIRCNQDNQREFEEKVTKQMISLLTKIMNVENGFTLKPKPSNKYWHNVPLGGTYVKLETKFREQLAQNFKSKHSNQNYTRSIKSAK